ncbi:MAG: RNA polymerase sigma factor [Saprospiraceae bacterium]|nr:RNA polymerase sigma factor [Saprospiraceae bacterium]
MHQSLTKAEIELIRACVRNDRWSQEQLYRKYFQKMLSLCMRFTQDKEEAQDILNQGFLRVFQKLHTFGFRGSLEGWIRKLVYHAAADHFKKRSRYTEFLILEGHEIPHDATALQKCYVDDLLTLVEKLPPATKQVFKLYAIEGYTHREIAEKVQISIGTSKWHLSEARTKLQAFMSGPEMKFGYAG